MFYSNVILVISRNVYPLNQFISLIFLTLTILIPLLVLVVNTVLAL